MNCVVPLSRSLASLIHEETIVKNKRKNLKQNSDHTVEALTHSQPSLFGRWFYLFIKFFFFKLQCGSKRLIRTLVSGYVSRKKINVLFKKRNFTFNEVECHQCAFNFETLEQRHRALFTVCFRALEQLLDVNIVNCAMTSSFLIGRLLIDCRWYLTRWVFLLLNVIFVFLIIQVTSRKRDTKRSARGCWRRTCRNRRPPPHQVTFAILFVFFSDFKATFSWKVVWLFLPRCGNAARNELNRIGQQLGFLFYLIIYYFVFFWLLLSRLPLSLVKRGAR